MHSIIRADARIWIGSLVTPKVRTKLEQVLVFTGDRPNPDSLGECPQGHSRERTPYGEGMQFVIKSLMHVSGLSSLKNEVVSDNIISYY
jgi:hypothetical protein